MFDTKNVIVAYTLEQAIEDGILVESLRNAGVNCQAASRLLQQPEFMKSLPKQH